MLNTFESLGFVCGKMCIMLTERYFNFQFIFCQQLKLTDCFHIVGEVFLFAVKKLNLVNYFEFVKITIRFLLLSFWLCYWLYAQMLQNL